MTVVNIKFDHGRIYVEESAMETSTQSPAPQKRGPQKRTAETRARLLAAAEEAVAKGFILRMSIQLTEMTTLRAR